ncbi:MAG: hypothetical protein WDM91_17400 [Rhizomicrobium sp.]
MNNDVFEALQWQRVLVWPRTRSVFPEGFWIDRGGIPWIVKAVTDHSFLLELEGLQHGIELPFDLVRKCQPGGNGRRPRLILRSQVWITQCDTRAMPFWWEPTLVQAAFGTLH